MTLSLAGVDNHGSTLFSLTTRTLTAFAYSPFGATRPCTGEQAALPGFNGERRDPLTGVTHLGNGYRAFSPALFRFTCPDSASPFGEGGINAYAYCDNDPVNLTDPSGHGPATWLIRQSLRLGVRLGLSEVTAEGVTSAMSRMGVGTLENVLEVSAQVATGTASAARQQRNPQQAKKLMWATLGLGMGIGARQGMTLGGALRKRFHRLVNRSKEGMTTLGMIETGVDYFNGKKTTTGFTDNFRGTHEPALILHGSPQGKVFFYEERHYSAQRLTGRQTYSVKPLPQPKACNAEEAKHLFFNGKHNETIPVISHTNQPLHLVACYSKRYAQAWAEAFQRPIVAYSYNKITCKGLAAAEDPDFMIYAYYPWWDLRHLLFGPTYIATPEIFMPTPPRL